MSRERSALRVVPPLSAESAEVVEPTDLATVYRRYAPYVAAVAHRLLGRDEDVDDTVQEVFVAAAQGLDRLRDPGATKAWLARVCVRTAHRRLQVRRLRRFVGLEEVPQYEAVADPTAGPEERAHVARVYRALDRLPAGERVAWVLRHVEGEKLQEVAEMCDCSLATTKRRIRRAGDALKEALSDE